MGDGIIQAEREQLDLHGRRLHEWTWQPPSPEGLPTNSPYDELADAIIASGAKLYNRSGKLVELGNKGETTPVEIWQLRYIIAKHIATREWTNHGTRSKPDWRRGGVCSFAFQPSANCDRKPNASVLKWLLKKGLVERAPKLTLQIKTPIPDKPPTYPKLTAAVAEAARYNGRHTERNFKDRRKCGLCAAHREATGAIAGELLPAVFGGEWKLAKGGNWPPHDEWALVTPLYDHGAIFYQRGARKPHGWHNSAIISQPYNHVFRDGVFHPEFVAAAQALSQRCQVDTWVNPELSAYFPRQSILVLLAGGLAPGHAPSFGFRAVQPV
jgi:hypothetical protein